MIGFMSNKRSKFTADHTMPNRIPDPVDHQLIDVKHNPGFSVPKPVKHIQYTENHPVFGEGQLSAPVSGGGMGGGLGGAYCPPGYGM